jgi:hypothetical protein
MSHLSREPISSLVLKLPSDRHTSLESSSHSEQKYALLSFQILFSHCEKKKNSSPESRIFLYQKAVIMQYNHHIRNQHQKLRPATYVLLKIIASKILPWGDRRGKLPKKKL